MNKKIRVGIIFGGKSAEHEVSVMSAKSICKEINKKKFDAVMVKISKQGIWQVSPEKLGLKFDVIFPVLHGTYGEDGSIQGLLKMLGLPFVGPDILGSAIGMDKVISKRLLREAKIPVAKFLVFNKGQKPSFLNVKKDLGLPLFIKPANLGSSVGVSKVRTEKEFKSGVKEAFRFDTKILIEQGVVGRELEVSVLGNEDPVASVPGEVIAHDDFYSYQAKYLDENGARLEVPAKLSKQQIKKIQFTAIKAYKTLCLEGMSRVDMFLTPTGKIVINEVNTIPGFTNISMYPKLWEVSGLSYSNLLDRLIELALKRHHRQHQLKTSI